MTFQLAPDPGPRTREIDQIAVPKLVNTLLKHFLTTLRIALGFSIFYYVFMSTGGWGAAKQFVSTTWILPALCAFTFFGAAIESKRLGLLCESQGIRVPFAFGFRLVAIGTLFTFTIPGGTGGDFMKLYYLTSESRGRGVELATTLVLDRLLALFSMLSVVVGLALLEWNLVRDLQIVRWFVVVGIIGMIGLILIAVGSCSRRIRMGRLYTYLTTRMPLHSYLKRAFDAMYIFREHKTTLVKAMLLSMFAHLVLGSLFMVVGTVLMPEVPHLITGLLALLALLANAIPITPGGIGIAEAVAEGVFASAGHAGGAQLIVAWRIAMLALCLIGAMLYIAGKRNGSLAPRYLPFLQKANNSNSSRSGGIESL